MSKELDFKGESNFVSPSSGEKRPWLHPQLQRLVDRGKKTLQPQETTYTTTWIDNALDAIRQRMPSARLSAVTLGTAFVAVEVGIPTVAQAQEPQQKSEEITGQIETTNGGEEVDWKYFPETGHALQGTFSRFWDKNGGLPVFGYPLTEEMDMKNLDGSGTFKTQYLERQRFEYHPENVGTPYEVLLGRMGADMLEKQGRPWRPGNDTPDKSMYFGETGYAIDPAFQGYWKGHGLDLGDKDTSQRESMGLFGMPITKAQVETNSSGDTVLTQWFERARLELHLDGTVKQGRLGAELFEALQEDRPENGKDLLPQTNVVDSASATVNGKTYTVESRVVRGGKYQADIKEEFKGYIAGVAAQECQNRGCDKVQVVMLEEAASFEDAKLKFPASADKISRVDPWSDQNQQAYPGYYESIKQEGNEIYVYLAPASEVNPNDSSKYDKLDWAITASVIKGIRGRDLLPQDYDTANQGAIDFK